MAKDKQDTALAILTKLVELHDIEQRVGKVGRDTGYDDVRKVRRESAGVWLAARELVHGPAQTDATPRNEAEAARWRKRAEAAAKQRGDKVAAEPSAA